MQLLMNLGAALLLALLLASPALDTTFTRFMWGDRIKRSWRDMLRDLAFADQGVVVITYLSKAAGFNTTTPPTAAEATGLMAQTAQVFWADTDTEAQVVHNWGFNLGPSFASFGFPFVHIAKLLGAGSNSFRTEFTFGLANSSKVFITKQVGAPGGTYLVTMFLPHSIIGGGSHI